MAKHIIDCTPKWKNLIPMFTQWIQSGTASQRKTAIESLEQLGEIADTFVLHRKHGGLTCKCGHEFKLQE